MELFALPFLIVFGSTFLVFAWAILWRNSSLLAPTRWHGSRQSGRYALTFDDGPDPRITPLVLDILKQKNVKATFFCVGREARRHPELLRRIHREGHLVANHSYDHDWRMNFWHPNRVAYSIVQGERALASVTGYYPKFYRGPVGIKSPPQALMGWKLGVEFVGWARSAWDGSSVGLRPEALDRIARGTQPGDIILLHDGKPGQNDAAPVVQKMVSAYRDHLAGTIDRLRARGLEGIRLDELLETSGVLEQAVRRERKSLFVKGWYSNLNKIFKVMMREHATPLELALALGLGVFVGCTPMFGLHMLIGLIAAIKLRMNKLAVFLGTNISNPLTGPFVILANIEVGCWLLTGKWLGMSSTILKNRSFFALGNRVLLYWIVGFPVATTALSALTALATYPIFRVMRSRGVPPA